MKITPHRLARMIDISGVRANVTLDEVNKVAKAAIEYNLICAFVMPCFTKILAEKLGDYKDIYIGGVVGFPSGADTTKIKIAQTKEIIKEGADEIDMVINIGALKSEKYEWVYEDIKAVVDASDGRTVKSIIEAAYLNDYEIAKASEIGAKAGVGFIKTGTGWADKPSTVQMIKIIKATVGNSVKIKAAGGVRTLETINEMIKAGCSRFGLGLNTAIDIMKRTEDIAFNE